MVEEQSVEGLIDQAIAKLALSNSFQASQANVGGLLKRVGDARDLLVAARDLMTKTKK